MWVVVPSSLRIPCEGPKSSSALPQSVLSPFEAIQEYTLTRILCIYQRLRRFRYPSINKTLFLPCGTWITCVQHHLQVRQRADVSEILGDEQYPMAYSGEAPHQFHSKIGDRVKVEGGPFRGADQLRQRQPCARPRPSRAGTGSRDGVGRPGPVCRSGSGCSGVTPWPMTVTRGPGWRRSLFLAGTGRSGVRTPLPWGSLPSRPTRSTGVEGEVLKCVELRHM